MRNTVQAVGIALCLASIIVLTPAHIVLQTINGEIGSENSTFYRLNREGFIRVELFSIYGDADLYVSDTTLRPSFDNFEQQAVTCGLDVVDIPSTFKRPVGVSVYGHPSYLNTTFILKIYQISDKEDNSYSSLIGVDTFFDNSENDYIRASSASGYTELSHTEGEAETEEYPFWTLLIGILKIILEILF